MIFVSKVILFCLIFSLNEITNCKLFNEVDQQFYNELRNNSHEVANLTLLKKQKNEGFPFEFPFSKSKIDFKIRDLDLVKEIEKYLPTFAKAKPKPSSKSQQEHKQKLLKILKKIIKSENVRLKNNATNTSINSFKNVSTISQHESFNSNNDTHASSKENKSDINSSKNVTTISQHESFNSNNDTHASSKENKSDVLELNKIKPQSSPKKQNQSQMLPKERVANNTTGDNTDQPTVADLEKFPVHIIDADNSVVRKEDKMKKKEGLNSTAFHQRFGEVLDKPEENFLPNLPLIESENILKQIANDFETLTPQETSPFGPLADLSLWLQPMNSQKHFLLNSTLSVDEKNPFILQESPLKTVDSSEKYSTAQLLLDNYSKYSTLGQKPTPDKDQPAEFVEVINLLQKLDESNNDVRLPSDVFSTKFIESSSNVNKNSLNIQNSPFSSTSFSNFSQSTADDGIPPEVLANLLVRLRVPTAQEIASVLPNATEMITPQLSTAFANFITNLSDATAQFIREVQEALMVTPLLGVLLALALIAIIWHIFEKKKKSYGYGYGHGHGHGGGGYHRRQDAYPHFRSFNSESVDTLVDVLKSLDQFEKRFKSFKF